MSGKNNINVNIVINVKRVPYVCIFFFGGGGAERES